MHHPPLSLVLRRTIAFFLMLLGFALTSAPPLAAQQGKVQKDTISRGGRPISPNICVDPCGPNPPTVWFGHTISGTIRTAAAITDTVHWCDDGGLTSSSRVVKQNNTALSTTYVTNSYSGCTVHAISVFTITPVVGVNTIYAQISDVLGQATSAQFSFGYDPRQVAVTPKDSLVTKPARSTVSTTFTIRNFTSSSVTYNLTPICANPNFACSAPLQLTVGGQSAGTAAVTYTTQVLYGLDTVKLRVASTSNSADVDTGRVAVSASQYATSVSFARNNNDDQNLGLCANACFAPVVAHSTVGYRTLGVGRNVTLLYHGDRSAVRPFVTAEITLGAGALPPNRVQLQATLNGSSAPFVNGDNGTINFSTAGCDLPPVVRPLVPTVRWWGGVRG